MSSVEVNVLYRDKVKSCGEGPIWLVDSAEFAFIDFCEAKVVKIDSVTNDWKEIVIPGHSCISLAYPTKKRDTFLGLCGSKIVAFDWNEVDNVKALETVDEGKNTRFNDGKADRLGRLWCGTRTSPGVETTDKGSLYVMDIDGNEHFVRKANANPVDLSNGMDWSLDNRTMYYIDTPTQGVYAFDYDAREGEICNQRVAIDFRQASTLAAVDIGHPDGCCVDAEDKLWVAGYGGSNICRFDPATGQMIDRITFDTDTITSCCFGGPHLNQLYVTSDNAGNKNGGSVYRVDGLNVKGLPPNRANFY